MESEDTTPDWSRPSSVDIDDWSIPSANSNLTFRVLTSNNVVDRMNAEINLIKEHMQLPSTVVRILLNHYKWDKQVLMEKYLACACKNSKDAFFRDAGVINPLKYKDYAEYATSTSTCEICYETTAVTGLQCGHKFCNCCWTKYLTLRINDGTGSTIPCPHSECDIILEEVAVKKFVTDPEVMSKYNRLICNHFVQWNKNLHWCTSPGCTYIIETLSYDCRYVTCLCKNQFCCECYKEWHAPIPCKLLAMWIKDDSVTQDYSATNTKACPNCNSNIGKNGGCPHITCMNCDHEFCWKCLKPWIKHDGSYKCNSPEETQAIQKSRSLVERMKYCWDRYLYNKEALEEERARYNLDWPEMEHHLPDLEDRVQILYRCRRFLMYSYAFIFYLEEDNRVYLLESNLNDLEAKTDKLTVILETFFEPPDIDSDDLPNKEEIRTKIIDNAVHCERLREKWLEDIEKSKRTVRWYCGVAKNNASLFL